MNFRCDFFLWLLTNHTAYDIVELPKVSPNNAPYSR
nr:MAG TPA: hypothetical protein [Bacteriophage sp.]